MERTFRDLRRHLLHVEFLVLADAALRLNLGRFDDLAEPAESPMETRLRWLLIQAGLPSPQVQSELRNSDGRFVGRADLYYRSARLVTGREPLPFGRGPAAGDRASGASGETAGIGMTVVPTLAVWGR